MDKIRILVLEDDSLQRRLIKENLISEGYEVFDAASGKQALEGVSRNPVDLAVVDYKLDGESGIDVIEKLHALNPLISVIIVTAFGNVENAVEAMKKGAYDYLVKPIDFKKLLILIERAQERQNLKKEIELLHDSLEERFSDRNFISASARMDEVALAISRAARSEATVLITGETGTGKDLIAKSIHFSSPRKKGPYLAVNIPSLPESLVEGELFGAEKGAFTGAGEKRTGHFEAASGGTLFLDEIGDLKPEVQVKLLRFLQDREFFRLGSSKTVKSDVRIIAATNQNLEILLKDGRFRSDLFFRLNVIRIQVPPLRERKGDIPPLVDHLIRRLNQRGERKVEGISAEAMKRLLAHSFPGNVRELENILERAVIFGKGPIIREEDLPLFLEGKDQEEPTSEDGSLTDRVRDLEVREIRRALKKTGRIKSRTARELGITERMLRYKMKIYGMEDSSGSAE